MNDLIQTKWRGGDVVGYDCIAFGDGRVIMMNSLGLHDPNTDTHSRYWTPLCDTTLESMIKYDGDIWSAVDIFHTPFEFEGQTIVYGDGAMGNEGYVASIGENNTLNWSLFFTFSNPIVKAEIIGRELICTAEWGIIIRIDIDDLTKVSVTIPKHI